MFRVVSFIAGVTSLLALFGSFDGAHAKDFRVLHTFRGGSDGAYPRGTLVKDQEGNFYGTTVSGGASGDGIVFKITPDGTETVLHAFAGADGAFPYGSLVLDAAGNLFGTTSSFGCCGLGNVFKLAPDGTLTTLHRFLGEGDNDGAYPFGGPVADKAGNFYGTTVAGGTPNNNCTSDIGCGTVFKITPDGTETILHAFCPNTPCSDGLYPYAALIKDRAGNLYGTTMQGGASWTPVFEGYGTVFKITPDGSETVLYSFQGKSDGSFPAGSLIFDRTGNLFGKAGGPGGGIVFKLAPDGTETVVHSFAGASTNGADNGLIFAKAGNLYGTWEFGGKGNCDGGSCGIAFKIAPDGTETDLHTFCAKKCADGFSPVAGLVEGGAGNLYGVTSGGGAMTGSGTVFKLKK